MSSDDVASIDPEWLQNMKLCYQVMPSIEDEEAMPPSNLVVAANNESGPVQLAIAAKQFWEVGQTIKVSWWKGPPAETGSAELRRRVKKYAKIWDSICNINLDFGDYGEDADIRVAFQPRMGSWSLIGKDCLKEDRKKPTMNFGWLVDSSPDEAVRSVTLHEFGHALGCIHEHQNPEAGIKWNKNEVIKRFKGPPNRWSEKKIKRNILETVATSMHSVFDPDSIMLYYFPGDLTLDGKGTHENMDLSAMDISFIKRLYPPQARDDGFFDTDEITMKQSGHAKEAIEPQALALTSTELVEFAPPFSEPPKMAIGLSRIDMSCKQNIAVGAGVDRITAQSAQVSVSTWDTSILYGGAATWVEARAYDSQWQFGVFSTQTLRDRNDTSSQVAQKVIRFEEAYDEPPVVVVALKLIDLDRTKDYRVKAYATDVKKDRFTIHVDTWGDSILYAGEASWMAYPANLSTAMSKSIITSEGVQRGTDRWDFPSDLVKKPTVRVFLNMIDIKSGTDLRIKTWVDQVTTDGLDWHAETSGDTKMRQAGISILTWI